MQVLFVRVSEKLHDTVNVKLFEEGLSGTHLGTLHLRKKTWAELEEILRRGLLAQGKLLVVQQSNRPARAA